MNKIMSQDQVKQITRILFVEDDEDFRDALTPRLQKRNFEVLTAKSAEEALQKVSENTIDIVLADIKLPGMNGVEFLSQLRDIDEHLPVILLTGYASLETAKQAVKLNAADYLLKPLDTLDELLSPIYKATYSYKLFLENKRLTDDLEAKVKALKQSEELLLQEKESVEQKNIALHEILAQIEIEKNNIKENILANIEELILPSLIKLQQKADPLDLKYFEIIKDNLQTIANSFGKKIRQWNMKLTPREIEICNMIRCGCTSKEISQLLNLSLKTTERHRNNVRKKLGIVKEDVNLTTYLQSL